MALQVILLVCSDEHRLQARYTRICQAGHLCIRADGLSRAFAILRQVYPTLVLTDAQLVDGRAAVLVAAVRAVQALEQVPIIVGGALRAEERARMAADVALVVQPSMTAADAALDDLLATGTHDPWSQKETATAILQQRTTWAPHLPMT